MDQDRVYGPWRQVEGYEGSGPVVLVISVLAVRPMVPRPTRNTKTRKIKSETAVPACGECLLVPHKATATRFCSHTESDS